MKNLPKDIQELKNICFVCGSKFCRTCGGMIVLKMEIIRRKKKTYVVSRFAPLGCFLAHNKKYIMNFYKNKKLVKMWKEKKK